MFSNISDRTLYNIILYNSIKTVEVKSYRWQTLLFLVLSVISLASNRLSESMATGRLRVCYQNLGHGVNCYEKFKDIENILNTRHPHVLFIGEKQIDDDSRTRLNFFNYEVETLDQSDNDRIWCAVSKSVEYKRRKDLESKDAQCI